MVYRPNSEPPSPGLPRVRRRPVNDRDVLDAGPDVLDPDFITVING